MRNESVLTQLYLPIYAGCIASAFSFFFFFISYSSPYWVESYPLAHNTFLHMGLWSVCFDRFVHPQDYHANVLTGCYWIFDRFFFEIGVWQWIDPHWLIGVQVLTTIAFSAKLCVVLILTLHHLLFGHRAAESTMAFAGELFISVLLTISVVTYGIMCQSREWMQRPEQNFLSWSYTFALLATLSSYIASAFLYCASYTDRASQEEVEKFDYAQREYGVMSAYSGGDQAFTGSRYGGGGSSRFTFNSRRPGGGVIVKVPPTASRPERVLTLDPDLRRMNANAGPESLFTTDEQPARMGSAIGGNNWRGGGRESQLGYDQKSMGDDEGDDDQLFM